MTTQTQIFTRNQYVREQTVSHDDYFEQFVTPETMASVQSFASIDELSVALEADKHLNSIPLSSWDKLTTRESNNFRRMYQHPVAGSFQARIPFNREAAKAAGEIITRSTLVCIAKCAARMLVEQHARQPAAVAA